MPMKPSGPGAFSLPVALTAEATSCHQRAQSTSCISGIMMETNCRLNSNLLSKSLEDTDSSNVAAVIGPEIIILEDVKSTASVVEVENASPLEEKFRRDIDVLMEENLTFLMKLNMSFHQIQGFQAKFEQLQPDISKLINDEKLKVNKDGANDQPAPRSETEGTEKRLRELKIELQVWLEQNEMFKAELQCRLDSLHRTQTEIEQAMEMLVGADNENEGAARRFTPYQAAKFQGEVSNMKQEINKVAKELQDGMDHVKALQTETEKGIILKSSDRLPAAPKAATSSWRNAPTRSRVPLRMFLSPAKKKKPSMFACVNPAFRKQNSDMAFFTKMK